jgi:sugar phosphate isomerase/epimerase
LEANLKRVSDLGYDGVELAIRDPGLVDDEELLKLLWRHKLESPAIGTGQAWGEEGLSFTDPDPQIRRSAVKRIKSHLGLAARLGAVVIIGLIRGTLKPGIEKAQAMAWLVKALRECSAAASSVGVRLALEPINRYETALINTAAEGLELIDQVGADNFGLLLDTFHMNIEEPSLEASISRAANRIFHFHAADSNRWYPGAGHINFHSILHLLEDLEYKGYVSGEFLPIPDAARAAEKAIAYLRSL